MNTVLDPTDLQTICEALHQSKTPLMDLSLETRARHLVGVLSDLQRLPADELNDWAKNEGMSPALLNWELKHAFNTWGGDTLLETFQNQIGPLELLTDYLPQGNKRVRVFPPDLVFHIQAGNLEAPGLEGMIFSLFLGAPCLVKLPSHKDGSVYLSGLFKKRLAERCPEMGRALAFVQWPGGEEALEAMAFSQVDVVLFHGGDRALSDLRGRLLPHNRLIAHAHRLSVVYVDVSHSKEETTATAIAEDLIRFDQRGCLSPRGIFVEGSQGDVDDFAALLHQALTLRQGEVGRPLSDHEGIEVAQKRGLFAFSGRALTGKSHTVVVAPLPFSPSPVGRFALIHRVESFDAFLGSMAAFRGRVQGVSMAVDEANLLDFAGALGTFGVPFITQVGLIQSPPSGWPADGRPIMMDLLRWSILAP